MSGRFSDEVLQRAQAAQYEAHHAALGDEGDYKRADRAGYAAMRAVLDDHLGRACTDNPLQHELLDLIKLMPESQTQEIVDFIFSMRAIRGVRPAAADTPQDRGALVATLGTLAVMLNACTIYHPSGELAPSFFVTRLKTVADALEATP